VTGFHVVVDDLVVGHLWYPLNERRPHSGLVGSVL
jgi:hypothetical protein